MFNKLFSSKRISFITGTALIVVFYLFLAAVAALLLMVFDIDRKYIPFISSLCISLASFLSAFITAKKHGEKGYLIGAVLGGISFLAVTVVSLFTSKAVFSLNTVFHLLLIMLSAVCGGILGVSSDNKKII